MQTQTNPARQMMDWIPGVAVLPRSRRWEKTHRSRAFRKIPPNVQKAVRQVAFNENLSVDSTAQNLLEYALMCCSRGDLDLDPVLGQEQRRTLIPAEGWAGRSRASWLEKNWGLTPPRTRPTKPRPERIERPWRDWPVASYRLSEGVFAQIVQLRQLYVVPAGELVARLLMHSLDAYEAGRLVFVIEQEKVKG